MKDVPIPYWQEKRKLSKSEALIDYLYNFEDSSSERELSHRWCWTRYVVRSFKTEISTKFQPNFNHLECWKSILKELSSTKNQPKINHNKSNIKLPIEDRKKKFIEDMSKYSDKYSRDMMNAFYRYWAEPTQGGDKMRFELQKTWSLAGRLATWKNLEK